MGKRTQSKGTCQLCKASFNKGGMTNHLTSCRPTHDQKATGTKEKVFHLLVEGRFAPFYWLHLEIPATATLALLDKYLRDIWLECCGHLSAFTIDGQRYSGDPMHGGDFGFFGGMGAMMEKSLNMPLQKVLQPGMGFRYEYDFGSTTELVLKVIGLHEGVVAKREPVRLLARNDPPAISCGQCGQPAIWVVNEGYESSDWFCDKCLKQEEDEDLEGYALPVVNSPRVGVCGYTGE